MNKKKNVSYLPNLREFMNGSRRITVHSCAKTGDNRKGGRSTLKVFVIIVYLRRTKDNQHKKTKTKM